MFFPEDIASKGFLKLEAIVELLKDNEEKDNLFADFPIGATIQDGGKRKRSDGDCCSYHLNSNYFGKSIHNNHYYIFVV